jgi:hypothetical protein
LSATVQAFLLCKSVVIQKGSRVADVNGVFDSITVPGFPATCENCALFVRLIVWDEATCSVSVVMESPSLARRQIMDPYVAKPDPNGKVQVICKISRVSFAEEGIYTLQLRVNGTTRSEFHVTAIKRRARRGTVEPDA